MTNQDKRESGLGSALVSMFLQMDDETRRTLGECLKDREAPNEAN